jgi:copper chaperone CopZ
MKSPILILFLSIFCFQGISSINYTSLVEDEKQFDIKTTLNCKVCEETIVEALESIDGVTYYGIDYENQVIDIKYTPMLITEEDIVNSILELGLPVNKVDGDKDAYNELPDCCKNVEDQKGKRNDELNDETEIEESSIKVEKDTSSKKEKKKKAKNKKNDKKGEDDSAWD